ncbi:hypothetical protein [Kushneria phosphatilytica]|uniref:hypothetical protein n=1 Tax=Kushneria phosphatilytica TaxID=657387 RepID=UPI00143B017E|nr:hypothetical protein [Kushneria phosphatilytica]
MKLFKRYTQRDRLPWRARHMFNTDEKIDTAVDEPMRGATRTSKVPSMPPVDDRPTAR